jgi:uncharacterized protein YsxB (DUF464 family)
MITVIYNRDINSVIVEGHARSGVAGHDLICASATILAHTLAAFAKNTQKAKQSHKLVVKLEDGYAEISCKPKSNCKAAITLVFDSICAGFELLANSYPKYISYEIISI